MKKYLGWVLVLSVASGFFKLLKTDFPVTHSEAKESYEAFALLKTGRSANGSVMPLNFRTDNDFVSPIDVYLRIPVIALFGLSYVSTRLPGIVVGSISLPLMYIAAFKILRDRTLAVVSTIVFATSIFTLQTNVFDLNLSILLLLILVGYCWPWKKQWIVILFFLLASLTRQGFWDYLVRTTAIQNVLPSYFGYIIDRRIAIGFTEGSPIRLGNINLNRLAFNKPYFILNGIFSSIVKPFDYETMTSVIQAGYILDKVPRTNIQLPKFFFWEIPLAVAGVVYAMKMQKNIKFAVLGTLICSFIFGSAMLFFLIPIVSLSYASWLKRIANKRWLLIFIGVFLTYNYIIFYDLYWRDWKKWADEYSIHQQQIWSIISRQDIESNVVTVTDRVGPPGYYYLYYHSVDPSKFLTNHKTGKLTSSGTNPVTDIGDARFYSFKFYESDRKPNQIWVGLPGEMVAHGSKPSDASKIPDGTIYKWVENVKSADQSLGKELWFVKTRFDPI